MKPLKLLSPCCNAPVYIYTSGYSEDPAVVCEGENCYNEWDGYGELI